MLPMFIIGMYYLIANEFHRLSDKNIFSHFEVDDLVIISHEKRIVARGAG